MSLVIRPADPGSDAASCAAIYAPFVADSVVSFELVPPDAAEFSRRIALYGPSHGWLVAEREGKILGYAYGSPHGERAAYEKSCTVAVYVDPGHPREGIARALYERLLPDLQARGYHAAMSAIALPNPASEGLHEAMGFRQVGVFREVGWKFGQWRDLAWWQRLL